MLERLVRGEAGADRGDLEEDAARLAEVDRPEVEAVDHRRRLPARREHPLAPGRVLVDRRCPGDVVNCPGAAGSALARLVVDVDGAAPLAPYRPTLAVLLLEAERGEERAARSRVAGVRAHAV